jgi:hypothetical protein
LFLVQKREIVLIKGRVGFIYFYKREKISDFVREAFYLNFIQ